MKQFFESIGIMVMLLLIIGASITIVLVVSTTPNAPEGFHDVRFYNGDELVSTQRVRDGASVTLELTTANFAGWSNKGETTLLDMSAENITRNRSFQARHFASQPAFVIERENPSMPQEIRVILTGQTMVEMQNEHGVWQVGMFSTGTLIFELHGSWNNWDFRVYHNYVEIFNWFDSNHTTETVFRGRVIV